MKRRVFFVELGWALCRAVTFAVLFLLLCGTRWYWPAYFLWLVGLYARSWRRMFLAERERRRTFKAAMVEAKRWAP